MLYLRLVEHNELLSDFLGFLQVQASQAYLDLAILFLIYLFTLKSFVQASDDVISYMVLKMFNVHCVVV